MTADETSPRRTLLRMTNAFQVSQAIHVAAALGIADLLDRPKSADELAETTGTHAPSLYIHRHREGARGLVYMPRPVRPDRRREGGRGYREAVGDGGAGLLLLGRAVARAGS